AQHRAANRLRYLVAILLIAVLCALGLTTLALGAEQSAVNNAATATNAQGLAQFAIATATNALGRARDDAATSAAYSQDLALAESRTLGRTASNLSQPGVSQDGELAALLGLQALKLAPSFEAYNGLLDANAALYISHVYQFPNRVTGVGFSPDSQHFV